MDSEIETHIDEARRERSYQTILRAVDDAIGWDRMSKETAMAFLSEMIGDFETRLELLRAEIEMPSTREEA